MFLKQLNQKEKRGFISEFNYFKNEFNGALYDVVIIENQPCMKNPKMKAIASTIYDYC